MIKNKFVDLAIKVHGNKYSYEDVPSTFNAIDKIPIICHIHGIFEQIARNHINQGQDCPKCAITKKKQKLSLSFEEFVQKSRKKHGDKHEYFKDVYINASTKTKIYCKKCQQYFYQLPKFHYTRHGCPICNPMPSKLTQDEFVKRLKETHPNLILLSNYEGNKKKVTVKCTIHNKVFEITPNRLNAGRNCPECYNERRGKTLIKPIQQVIDEANNVHNNFFRYPSIDGEYKTSKSKITIICPLHGEFKQSMNKHINQKQGCPKCNKSHMEIEVAKLLSEHNIKFIEQKRFEWLGLQSLDFYLPEYNIAIECQGEQHFLSRKIFGNEDGLNCNINRDLLKATKCKNNNVRLLYVIPKRYYKFSSNKKFNHLYDADSFIFEKGGEIIQAINKSETIKLT